MQLLRIGVVEADEQHGNDLPTAITHGGVLGHVVAVEEQSAAHVILPGQQALIGRVLVIKRRSQSTSTILLGQRGGDANEFATVTHEYRGHTRSHAREVINLGELVVQARSAQVKRRCLQAADAHTLFTAYLQPCAEALFEQSSQTLRALTQAAVEGFELVGQQPRLAAQVLFASDQIGLVE